MQALVCNSYGPPENLNFQSLEKPSPGPKEVLIKIHACGLNFPDTLTIMGKDQYGIPLPFVPCREYSGIVVALGSSVTDFSIGDRVMVDTMSGALQEYACAPTSNTHKIPDNMSFQDASSFIITYGTAYHALIDRGFVQPGNSLAILGAAGGVGSASTQIGKLLNAEVIACVGSEEKEEFCKQNGADFTINYSTEDIKTRLKEISKNEGIDIICDMVGGANTNSAFRAIAWNGKHLIVGFAVGEIPSLPLNLPLLKGASLTGVFFSTFCKKFPAKHRENTSTLLRWYKEGKLKPHIYASYPFKQAKDAFYDIINREVKGKVIIDFTL